MKTTKTAQSRRQWRILWRLMLGTSVYYSSPIALLAPAAEAQVLQHGFDAKNIVSPRIAVTYTQMRTNMDGSTCTSRMHNWFPDAPIVALNPTSQAISWFSSGYGTMEASSNGYDRYGIRVRKTVGTEWNPMGTDGSGSVMATCKRSSDTCNNQGDVHSPCVDSTESGYAFRSFNGLTDVYNLWFTNFYHISGNEYIGFMHEESPLPDQCQKGSPKTWRIGLAYSSDSGVSWKYIGRSIEGHTPQDACDRDGDFSGAYAIHNNELYLYYNDVNDARDFGVGVAKAHLPRVIQAVRNGIPPGFTKLIGANTWCARSATVRPGCNPAFVFAGWPQNVFNGGRSSYNGKYYTTGAGTLDNRHVIQLFEQDYPWSSASVVGILADEPFSAFADRGDHFGGGHWYGSSLPGNATLENNEFDGSGGLVIYFTRLRSEQMNDQRGIYRWQFYPGTTSADKHSGDYSSAYGGASRWSYRFLSPDGSWSDLIKDPSWGFYYNPNDDFAFIDRFGMRDGVKSQPGLWWKAPAAGTINVRFTVRKGKIGCDAQDGVTAIFALLPVAGGEVQYMNQLIDGQDVLGYSYFGAIPVKANDQLVFRTDQGANNNCDYVLWDPWIGYQ